MYDEVKKFYIVLNKTMKVFFDHCSHSFKTTFQRVMKDPRGWTSRGYSFDTTNDSTSADIIVRFETNVELEARFGHLSVFKEDLKGLSITVMNSVPKEIYINRNNWNRPPAAFQVVDEHKKRVDDHTRLMVYQAYIVQHELGHAIGLDHPSEETTEIVRNCHPMKQQSKDTSTCRANPWIHEFEKTNR